MDIPKIIHQTYKSIEEIPEHWKESHNQWKKLHPEAVYMFWSDKSMDSFVKKNFPEFYSYYKKFPYTIQRVDAFRYMILYTYGGIYSDLDIVPNKNVFNEMGHGDLFLTYSANSYGLYTNMLMASKSQHPFWLEVIEEMKKKEKFYYIGKHLRVFNTTGPFMLNRVCQNTTHNITLLSYLLYNPSDISDVQSGKSKEKKDTVLRIVEGSSWNSIDSKIYNFFYINRKIFIGILLTLGIILFILACRWVYLYFWTKYNCDCVCETK